MWDKFFEYFSRFLMVLSAIVLSLMVFVLIALIIKTFGGMI